ncbi:MULTISPECIES: alpha/beta hydrolase-fold protein [unclassified Peribacillus]|uniref:alpha/beta hydrolase-fold protein n=1 Tax=unclassified Peribacillus TaxID=2675266 RepID=UPI0033AE4951
MAPFNGSPWPSHEGAENFLKFIEEDLNPEIDKRFKVDQNSQTLFGHSLGGLFAIYVLFENPYAFQTYIAGSPSLIGIKSGSVRRRIGLFLD